MELDRKLIAALQAGDRGALAELYDRHAGVMLGLAVRILRAGFGVLIPEFNTFPFDRLGDGVNVNDGVIPESFPYLAPANSGRNSRHVDPGERGERGERGCVVGPCSLD